MKISSLWKLRFKLEDWWSILLLWVIRQTVTLGILYTVFKELYLKPAIKEWMEPTMAAHTPLVPNTDKSSKAQAEPTKTTTENPPVIVMETSSVAVPVPHPPVANLDTWPKSLDWSVWQR